MKSNLTGIYRVGRSVNPTNRIIAKRARDSSGPVPLYDFIKDMGIYKFFGLVVLGILLVTAVAFAQQNPLEDELAQLEQEISDAGYSWLADYNVSYPFIEVYEFNSSRLIISFPEISAGLYKIFLTNLSSDENYSQDVFDLRVKNLDGNSEKIPYEILEKKMRIDEIRKELNQEGGFK